MRNKVARYAMPGSEDLNAEFATYNMKLKSWATRSQIPIQFADAPDPLAGANSATDQCELHLHWFVGTTPTYQYLPLRK
jgi:hypothetical protein